jgi:hypothetical protein
MIHLKIYLLGARIHKPVMRMMRAIFLLSAWFVGQHAMADEEPEVKELRVALQAKYADYIEVKLNSVKEDVKFQIVDMKTPMVELGGKRYCAFRFKTGDEVHQLTWCFRVPRGLQSWYIIPESNTMEGFTHFRKFIIREDIKEWGSAGDWFVVQSLPSTSFKPNTGYIMWFNITDAADSSINLSLNMTNVPDFSRYSSVFPTIKL